MANSKLVLSDMKNAGTPAFIDQVRAALNLPADARIEMQNVARGANGGAQIDYVVTLPVELHGKEFGIADGVSVDEQIPLALNFDARGEMVDSQMGAIDERHLRLVKDNVQKLVAANAVYLAKPGETVDTDMLRAQRKPWYIETDAHARKRLRRAYMA